MYSHPINICPNPECKAAPGETMRCIHSTRTKIVYWCPVCEGHPHEFSIDETQKERPGTDMIDSLDRGVRRISTVICTVFIGIAIGYAWAYHHFHIV